ncbi:tetratricopeptide repeat protein [bacterium]|nr:tetratricopeptide repeat protein [bacterium]
MELTLEQALQKGIEAHRAGKAQDAERYYAAILNANPRHPDANHNMGLLAVDVGKVDAALLFFTKALEVEPNVGQFWLSYIEALIKLDRTVDAKAIFDQAISKGVTGDGIDQMKNKLESVVKIEGDQMNEVILSKALNLRENGKYNEAIDLLLHQTSKSSKDPNIPVLISHCYILIDNLEQAKFYLDVAKNLNPSIALVGWTEARLLLKKKKVDEALVVAKKTNKLFPNDIEGMGVLGACFGAKGDFDQSLAYLNKAIELRPNFSEALISRGLVSLAQGNRASALIDIEKAHNLKPHIKQIWSLILGPKMERREFKQAIILAEQMSKMDPNDEKIFATLGSCHQQLKNYDQAIEFYTKALALKPDFAQVYNNMGRILSSIVFTKPDRGIEKTIVSLLDQKSSIRPKDIAKSAISLLKAEPHLKKNLQLGKNYIIENTLKVISDLSDLPLLLKLMSVCPLPDLELERLFTNLRYSIISNISSLEDASAELIEFQTALALHCFTNEYLYNCTKKEEKIIQSLEANLKKVLSSNKQPSAQAVLAIASYRALNEFDWCNLLVVTDKLEEVFKRQVVEPNQEKKLKINLPILKEVSDNVSSKVRQQYEENPYPRWVKVGLPLEPRSISYVVDELKLRLYDNNISSIKRPDILIAGCGTGQHSIVTATRFKSSKVLAIDLSLSSLAYAKRKTNELSVENVEYMQADILDLKMLNKQFDIIESSGVLHHMDNPMAGWKVLTHCLKPGGLMKIGLYSEIARQHVAKIRKETTQTGIGSSDIEMKSRREIMLNSNEDHHKRISTSSDFYSMSTLKDLIFHVQEHRFTIPQIKKHLKELGLLFCGFESQKIISNFKIANTQAGDPYDLEKWQAYEKAHPRTFSGMYQFWCQKVD